MEKMSQFLAVNKRDMLKGLIVAVLTAAVTGLMAVLKEGGLPTVDDLKAIGLTTLAATLSYILKNFLTNTEDKFLATEPEQEDY